MSTRSINNIHYDMDTIKIMIDTESRKTEQKINV